MYCIVLYYIILYYIILYYIILYYIILYYIILYYIILYYILLYYILLYYILLYYIVLYDIIPYYTILYHTILSIALPEPLRCRLCAAGDGECLEGASRVARLLRSSSRSRGTVLGRHSDELVALWHLMSSPKEFFLFYCNVIIWNY